MPTTTHDVPSDGSCGYHVIILAFAIRYLESFSEDEPLTDKQQAFIDSWKEAYDTACRKHTREDQRLQDFGHAMEQAVYGSLEGRQDAESHQHVDEDVALKATKEITEQLFAQDSKENIHKALQAAGGDANLVRNKYYLSLEYRALFYSFVQALSSQDEKVNAVKISLSPEAQEARNKEIEECTKNKTAIEELLKTLKDSDGKNADLKRELEIKHNNLKAELESFESPVRYEEETLSTSTQAILSENKEQEIFETSNKNPFKQNYIDGNWLSPSTLQKCFKYFDFSLNDVHYEGEHFQLTHEKSKDGLKKLLTEYNSASLLTQINTSTSTSNLGVAAAVPVPEGTDASDSEAASSGSALSDSEAEPEQEVTAADSSGSEQSKFSLTLKATQSPNPSTSCDTPGSTIKLQVAQSSQSPQANLTSSMPSGVLAPAGSGHHGSASGPVKNVGSGGVGTPVVVNENTLWNKLKDALEQSRNQSVFSTCAFDNLNKTATYEYASSQYTSNNAQERAQVQNASIVFTDLKGNEGIKAGVQAFQACSVQSKDLVFTIDYPGAANTEDCKQKVIDLINKCNSLGIKVEFGSLGSLNNNQTLEQARDDANKAILASSSRPKP